MTLLLESLNLIVFAHVWVTVKEYELASLIAYEN